MRFLHALRPPAKVVPQFVGREVTARQPGTSLEANDVETINLRDIFLAGVLPVTGGAGFATCTDPLTNPVLGEPGRALLRLQHTGQPVAPSGLCWSSSAGAHLASGFITVDAANGCSELRSGGVVARRRLIAAAGDGATLLRRAPAQ